MRDYELMAIYPLDEEKSKSGEEALKAALAQVGAEITEEKVFGDRDLTYEVKGFKRGRFMLYNVRVNPDKISMLDSQFHLNAALLKYMFVRKDETAKVAQ